MRDELSPEEVAQKMKELIEELARELTVEKAREFLSKLPGYDKEGHLIE